MVERQLPKLNVAGSNPVSRSKEKTRKSGLNARFFGLFLFLDFAVWSLFGRYCREKIPKDTKRNERASVGKPRRPLAVFIGWVCIHPGNPHRRCARLPMPTASRHCRYAKPAWWAVCPVHPCRCTSFHKAAASLKPDSKPCASASPMVKKILSSMSRHSSGGMRAGSLLLHAVVRASSRVNAEIKMQENVEEIL